MYQIINDLSNLGYSKEELTKKMKFFDSLDLIIKNKPPLLIMTEWDEFKSLNINKKTSIIFDFRNILDKTKVTYRF